MPTDLPPELIQPIVRLALAEYEDDMSGPFKQPSLDTLFKRQRAYLPFAAISKAWRRPALVEGVRLLALRNYGSLAMQALDGLLDREGLKPAVRTVAFGDVKGSWAQERAEGMTMLLAGMTGLVQIHLVPAPDFPPGSKELVRWPASRSLFSPNVRRLELSQRPLTARGSLNLGQIAGLLDQLPSVIDLDLSIARRPGPFPLQARGNRMRLQSLRFRENAQSESSPLSGQLLSWLLTDSTGSLLELRLDCPVPDTNLRLDESFAWKSLVALKRLQFSEVSHYLSTIYLRSLMEALDLVPSMPEVSVARTTVSHFSTLLRTLVAATRLSCFAIRNIDGPPSPEDILLALEEAATYYQARRNAGAMAQPHLLIELPPSWAQLHDAAEWALAGVTIVGV